MYRTSTRSRHNGHSHLSGDLRNIRDAIKKATRGVTGRAGELLSDSIEDVRHKSVDVQKNVAYHVAKKPVRYMAAAALTGWLIGFLTRK